MAFQTFTPMQYLKIDVAGSFGLDKETWETRLSWFYEHEEELNTLLHKIENGGVLKGTLFEKADAPAMFYAGLNAWNQAKKGLPISHAVSLDATASGAQLLALLVGCEKSAKHCNLIDVGDRVDFYTDMHKALCERVENPGKISRSMAKDAMVPWFYGSEAEPKTVFGEGAQLMAFKATMAEEAPGINALRDALTGLWDPNALAHEWTLPDNFHVRIKVMTDQVETVQFLNRPVEIYSKINAPVERSVSNAANSIHSIDGLVVREILRRCYFDSEKVMEVLDLLTRVNTMPGLDVVDALLYTSKKAQTVKAIWSNYKKSGFLSARIIELLDEKTIWIIDDLEPVKELILSLPEKPFKVLTVHDCFRVHPNYANDLRKQYNRILFDLARSDILSWIVSQICKEEYHLNKMGYFADEILEANYALS